MNFINPFTKYYAAKLASETLVASVPAPTSPLKTPISQQNHGKGHQQKDQCS